MKKISSNGNVFLTAEVAKLVDVPEWRVIKIAGGEEYGIKPRRSAKGSGSRRVYDVENVGEIALAVRLLETGLRPKVIGEVIELLRKTGQLRRELTSSSEIFEGLTLGIGRKPQIGRPLNQSRKQQAKLLYLGPENYFGDLKGFWQELPETVGTDADVLIVDIGPMLKDLKRNLQQMIATEGNE